ncbi:MULTISPECIES: carbonic anhydrase [Cetobacterium]|jgi:carbonic anhydrase|uniref:Carbonic anhydrase n=1 Tax=Cetobacterium somerae ATCC BAA-474 TaxID=1319815 RepID=U7V595_9FUSO|nr:MULTISPECIES: carbonic anhydrase [Cetobacterium]ERT66676.1 carbonate dehydratase [Cetobacterium somerae ATCC BAA-474]MBC2852622.1 carbonic anhydrase [Cetobacterium sp. 2G large]MCQ9627438.1 carbonic anhydrase [Cetobacterium somerae]WVJ00804.1 carbonic anhydrase [Cetobacterium somerae]
MQNYNELLEANLEWVEKRLDLDKDYFKNLSKGQNPPFLYIGCSDSRMPIDTFTQSEPGSFFIHRNIANQVFSNDMNFLATLEYAVEQLEVEHIIVSGHYECGGIKTAHDKCRHSSIISSWLMPIKKIEVEHKEELENLATEQERLDRLTELNVLEQLKHIFELSVIRNRIENGKYPRVHGWVLDIRSGKIVEIEIPIEDWKSKGIIPKEYQV